MLLDIINFKYIMNVIIFSGLGIVILFLAFWIFEKITPEKIWHEIVMNKNVAVAILAASIILSLGIIISSAIHE